MADAGGNAVIDITDATYRLVWGIVAHLIADWLFQNAWMAENKRLLHPAMFIHAVIHGIFMTPFFTLRAVIALTILHAVVDTRIPLFLWQKLIKQTVEGELATHVSIWADQTIHIAVIAVIALLDSRVI